VGQRDVVPYNRLAVYQDLRFTYDLHGNNIERRIGWHTVQHYCYSPEHQIVEARVVWYRERPAEGQTQPAPAATEQVTHYRYDALGRRIEKRDVFGCTAFLRRRSASWRAAGQQALGVPLRARQLRAVGEAGVGVERRGRREREKMERPRS